MMGVHADDRIKLRIYRTEVYQSYTQYGQIITDEPFLHQNGDIAIHFRMPGRQISLGK